MMTTIISEIENACNELINMGIAMPTIPDFSRKEDVEKFADEIFDLMELVGSDAWEGETSGAFERINLALGEFLGY